MPKLDNSIVEENVRVTRSSRRAGSVDLDFEQSSQHTPLKSNILETISETDSIDSRVTPRRGTRRSIISLDLNTPQKKFNLTKENLARLDNFNEGAETPPSASKRITRRTSITSEDVPGVAKTSATLPFVKLARTKVPIISEDGKENTKRARGRPPKSESIKNIDTIKTQNNKLNSIYNTRRSVSSSPSVSFEEIKVDETQNTHTPIEKSPQKIVETSNTLNSSKLDKTPIGSLLARTVKNQTSTPNIPSSTVESKESIDKSTIEIEESSSDSEINDSHDDEESLVEYYRNSSLKKFTGTVQNKVTEGEPPQTEAKPIDENLLNNENNSDDSMTDNEKSCSTENIPLKDLISRTQNKSKLSLNNTSNIETQNIERDGLNNSSKISDTGTLVNQNDNADTNYEIINKSQSTMDNKNENDDKVTQVSNKDSSDNHITLETPTKQSVNTPGSSKKGTPSPVILAGSEKEVILEKLDISSKTSFLTKLATPGKQDSPLKQGTPMKQATPAKQGTPMKQATPAKPTTTLEENLGTPKSTPTKPATPLVEKMRTPKARESLTKINKSIDSASIAESPAKSRNSSQAIEINGNTSKVLFNQDDDVSIKQLVNENCKLNNSVNIVNESVSILSSSDDSENTNGSSDPSMIDTFENFTDNLFRTKAKSCSPKVPKKNLLQSQAISSSFHGAVKTDKEINCDELTKSCDKVSNQSKSASGIFVIEDDNLPNESEINVQDTIKTSKFENRLTYVVRADSHKPDMASFIEEDNNEIVSDIADVVSDVKISSSKKPKRRQSLYVENEMSMKSFVDEENHEEIGINVSTTERNSTKKQKRHSSSIVDSIIPLDTTVGESFVKADNQEADDVSEELKTTAFVTQRKNKMECKLLVYESDCDNQTAGPSNTSAGLFVETDNDLNISSLNVDDTSVTKRENKLDSKSLVYETENDDQQATLSNTSAGAFVETDNDLNISSLNDTNKKLNRSKTKKVKSPKVVAEKRKISLEEIEETCNKILQERELARKKLREQFAKKKGKKKTKIINDANEEVDDSPNKSLDRTPKSLGKTKETEILSPKLKQQLEHETKQRSANSSQIKMDLSVSSHYSDSSQTKKTKKQSQKASPTATAEPIQVSSPKSKKIKTPPSNHQLSDNELEENKISQSTEVVQMRAEKRKHKHPTLTEEQNTPELHSPKGKKLKKQKSQKLTPIIGEQPVPMSSTKTKKIKIPKIQLNDSIAPEQPISSRRLPDSILNQLDEKQTILESSQAGEIRGKKRKLKLPTFIEKELTPEIRPSGFKVSPITPKILPNNFRVSPITPKFSNNFRVSVMPKTKLPKKKLSFNEPTNVLPKPVWTTAGVFEESDMEQENRKNIAHSTTNFIVEDIGDNLNRAYSKVDKHRKAEMMEFKNKSLFRANVPRADAKHVLKSLRFEKGNIKFISK